MIQQFNVHERCINFVISKINSPDQKKKKTDCVSPHFTANKKLLSDFFYFFWYNAKTVDFLKTHAECTVALT